MTDLVDVIEGLRARIDTIEGLTVYDHVPGTVDFPAALIVPPTIPGTEDLDDGTYTAMFEVPVLVGASADAENQKTLVPFIDPQSETSIKAAIDGDRSLGGLSVDALWRGAPRRLTFDEIAAYKAWGQVVLVQVIVD